MLRKSTSLVVMMIIIGTLLIACSDQSSDDSEGDSDPTADNSMATVELNDLDELASPEANNNLSPTVDPLFADLPIAMNDDRLPVTVPEGDDYQRAETLYNTQCAACHGINGEGQQPDPLAPGMAPPHDETGHTWHHPDQVNFATVWKGIGSMQPYEGILSEEDLLLILGYIKQWWGEEQIESQAFVTNRLMESQ